ncbi:MAG: FAD:protein FMN transferase [Planctomycetota bacterium]
MPERDTTRRDFLHGKSAAAALRAAGDHWLDDQPADRHSGAATLTVTRRAMACDFQVRLPASRESNDVEPAMAALDLVEAIEDRLTVYREFSELQELNGAAAYGPAEAEPDVFALLQLADRLHAESNGAFDVTAGPLSDVWGFSRRDGRLPSEDEIAEAMAAVGWGGVRLDADELTVAFDRDNLRINFNSVGKGHALDEAASLLRGRGVESFLLHGGRSSLLACGEAPDGGPGWGVGIRHPLRPSVRLAECRLSGKAFSTSGSKTQCFIHNGKRYGHLIDPRTGWPAEGVHSVSVLAATGAEADALSTMLYVMGYDSAAAYCEDRPDVQALFVLPGEGSGAVRVEALNADPECWRLA